MADEAPVNGNKRFSLTPVADKASELKESNYIVKSALNMELIWCPSGKFIMGPGSAGHAGVSPHLKLSCPWFLSWENGGYSKDTKK